MSLFDNASSAFAQTIQTGKFDDLDIEYISPVGNLPLKLKKELAHSIQKIINFYPSHSVTGAYTKRNIVSRPENHFIVVNGDHIILNISDRQIIILENSQTALELQFLHDFIKLIDKSFIFGSGKELVNQFKMIPTDNECQNIVYQMKQFYPLENIGNFNIVRLDDADNMLDENNILEIIKTVWGYDSLAQLDTPHVVSMSEGVVQGGARVNALVDNIAIIGGVKTFRQYRGKGIGSAVCSELFRILREQNLNIFLETDTMNIPAQKIYEKQGFEKIGFSYFYDIGTSVINDAIIGDRDY